MYDGTLESSKICIKARQKITVLEHTRSLNTVSSKLIIIFE